MEFKAEEGCIEAPDSEGVQSTASIHKRWAQTQPKTIQQNLTIITQFFPPDFAATGQLIYELALELAKLGIRVRVFAGQPGYAYDEDWAPAQEELVRNAPGSVKLRRTRAARLSPKRIRGKTINGLLFFIRAGLHLLRHQRYQGQLLLTSAPAYLPILGWLLNRLCDRPYAILIYDLYPDVAVQLGVVSEQHGLVRLWHWLNRQVWREAKNIIVLNTAMRDRLIQRCPECSPRITTIHNWADPDYIKPLPKTKNWFAQLHGLEREFTVLYSGNMGRCHDLETLLEAMALLADEPVRFVFIGDGAKAGRVREAIEQCHSGRCLWLPYQQRTALPYSLTCGDLSVVSLIPGVEGAVVPSKLYAMLAAGRPIAAICEPGSYLRELVQMSGCGRAFDNGDAASLAQYILALMHNPSESRRLGQAARTYLLRHFTPQQSARRYFEALHANLGAD
ncbi:glycosyltransferase family 4 protein [Leptolyngbya sp. FACHB-261]|nr:glycosyltransferase family 4 protein [Leptolyngbya sp. FACHB-261]